MAEVAQGLLTNTTQAAVSAILPPYAEGQLSRVASWADRVKRYPEYRNTSRLHFINSQGDFPPEECIVKYPPPVGDAEAPVDVLTAIDHYAGVMRGAAGENSKAVQEALRFLIHFYGDMHQPLHSMVACA